MKQSHLVIGMGEVGTALANVLYEAHDVSALDAEDKNSAVPNGARFDMAHICFPWSDTFVPQVERYQRTYDVGVTVIHSTVPIGTSRACRAVHSPVMGRHPHLAQDMMAITKFIGGTNGSLVAHAFRAAGMNVYLVDAPETTELIKLFSTLYLGVCVEFTKEIKRFCDLYHVPFEAWTLWNRAYNEAVEFGMQRPNLVPMGGRIGGHCVLPNAEMIESEFAKLVKRRNE